MSKREAILDYLRWDNPVSFVSPTKIGLYLGYDYSQASSSVCPTLKTLVKEGLVLRNARGHYKIKNPSKPDQT